MARTLIVNADDFGLSGGINRGVAHAHEHGIVTSASVMVCWTSAPEAAAYARQRPGLSVGLHLDLAEWAYREHAWHTVYRRVAVEDARAVAAEVERQLRLFRDLLGRDPTHLDSHQHLHRGEPVRSITLALAAELGVPLRDVGPAVRYCGDFYGQGPLGEAYPDSIGVEALLAILRSLPEGTTELACHPGFRENLRSPYSDEREREVQTLCDPRVRAELAEKEIELRSFSEIGTA